ncbi:MAG: menaquinone biosynthesis protein [Smithella sp.]
MKLGYINYLNCYPYYYHMFERQPIPDVKIVPAYPSTLNAMMSTGELDMSPISAAAYADMEDEAVLLPDFCLSSIGYVHSVILASLTPIEDLDGKRIGLSSASKTSVVLLKVLLQSYYHIEPVFFTTDPNPRLKEGAIDAALIIGNEAMQQQEIFPYVYDLGDLWLRKTGYPVVFAVFALRKSIIKKHADQVAAVIGSYRRSLALLESDRELLISKAKERYPTIRYDVDSYYRTLKYVFTPALRDALAFYLDKAGSLGLLKKVGPIHFMNGDERQP